MKKGSHTKSGKKPMKYQTGGKVVSKTTVTKTPKKVKTTSVTKKSAIDEVMSSYKGMKDAWGNPVGGEGTRPPFTPTKAKYGSTMKKKPTTVKKAKYGSTVVKKAQSGTRQRGVGPDSKPHPIVDRPTPKKTVKRPLKKDELSKRELSALSHQFRGEGSGNNMFVKKAGSIINETGMLTEGQRKQLSKHMSKASLPQKIYEAMPNVGRMVGKSAADLPKDSKLMKQKYGGKTMKKAYPASKMSYKKK